MLGRRVPQDLKQSFIQTGLNLYVQFFGNIPFLLSTGLQARCSPTSLTSHSHLPPVLVWPWLQNQLPTVTATVMVSDQPAHVKLFTAHATGHHPDFGMWLHQPSCLRAATCDMIRPGKQVSKWYFWIEIRFLHDFCTVLANSLQYCSYVFSVQKMVYFNIILGGYNIKRVKDHCLKNVCLILICQ